MLADWFLTFGRPRLSASSQMSSASLAAVVHSASSTRAAAGAHAPNAKDLTIILRRWPPTALTTVSRIDITRTSFIVTSRDRCPAHAHALPASFSSSALDVASARDTMA